MAESGQAIAGTTRWPGSRRPARQASAPAQQVAVHEPLAAFALLVIALLLVRTVAVEPFQIPSESMLPTLRPGDRLFVDKLAYGAAVPFTGLRLPALREPLRGEVVVFEVARRGDRVAAVDAEPGWPRERLVKRIVGVPGDRVTIAATGLVSVNGAPVEAWPTGELVLDSAGRPLLGQRAVLGAREHRWLDDPGSEGRVFSLVVPARRYLLLGDNRDHSNDGRRFGTVRRVDLTGPATRIYWSRNPAGRDVRWSRIGDRVQ